MSIETVSAWINSLPRVERNQSLVICEGRAYTPNEILTEVQSGSELGKKLQGIVERREFTDIEAKYALAVLRLRERMTQLPESFRFVAADGTSYSPAQMLAEIEKGSRIGRSFVEDEMTRMQEVLEK
jgi:hypothetical protein